MKKVLFSCIVSSFAFSFLYAGNICHTTNGTDYGQIGVAAYAKSNHGPDGSLFLDPYFKCDLENLSNKRVLDAGCGAAPWSIYAAENGGEVYAIDIQDKMIEVAQEAVQRANLADKIFLSQGDVASLPYQSDFFDKEISICVGCNLPPEAFEKHFCECNRTLKNNGVAVFGAPNSLDVVFTNGTSSELDTQLHIKNTLAELPDNPSPEQIANSLVKLNEVLSATFYLKNNRIALVTSEKDLNEGEPIWRKLPELVVPNRFYSKERYLEAISKYNFDVQKIDLPHFKNENERIAYNSKVSKGCKLGKEYVGHAPFVIFHVRKKGDFNSEISEAGSYVVNANAKSALNKS